MTERVLEPTGQQGQEVGALGVRTLGTHRVTFNHLTDPAGRLQFAREQATESDTLAVTVHDGTPVQPQGADLLFALHLAEHRRQHLGLECGAPVVSAARPALAGEPAALIRIPHLVLTRSLSGTPIDGVLWEVMSTDAVGPWLGGANLPDQHFFEQHLAELLQLRRAHRAGLLEGTRLGERLAGAYLSIRAVYLNEELVRDLVA